MDVSIISAKPPTYNPYDEDVAGSHNGTKVECVGGGVVVSVQEVKSGIGESYEIFVGRVGETPIKLGYVFLDDEGEFCYGAGGGS